MEVGAETDNTLSFSQSQLTGHILLVVCMSVDDSLESLTDTQLPPISINHQQFNMVNMYTHTAFFEFSLISLINNCVCCFFWYVDQVGMSSSSSIIPRWLQILLAEKFFSPCAVHECANKNDKNIFCLDCCMSICLHCSHTHRPYHLLQVHCRLNFYTHTHICIYIYPKLML